MPGHSVIDFHEERAVVHFMALRPQPQPIRARGLGCSKLVTGRDSYARSMIGDDPATEARAPKFALDAESIADEAFLREFDAIVNPVVFGQEVLGQWIEEIERVERLPGHRRHVSHLKVGVRESELGARAPRRLDQLRALLDADEIDRRRDARGDERELSGAGTDIENTACAGPPQQVRRAPCHGDRRPEAPGEEPDGRRVHRIEGIIVGVVGSGVTIDGALSTECSRTPWP